MNPFASFDDAIIDGATSAVEAYERGEERAESLAVDPKHETIVPKSTLTPNTPSLDHLRAHPDSRSDFDAKFGLGQAALYLSEPPPTQDVEPEPVAIDTGHILQSMEMDGGLDAAADAAIDATMEHVRARDAQNGAGRDFAIIQSFAAANDKGVRLDGDAMDKAVAAARANFATAQRNRRRNANPAYDKLYLDQERVALARQQITLETASRQPGWVSKQLTVEQKAADDLQTAIIEAANSGVVPGRLDRKYYVASARADEMRAIAQDRKEGVERMLNAPQRLELRADLAAKETELQQAKDSLDAARRTPGLDLGSYEDQVAQAQMALNRAQEAHEWASQMRPVDEPTYQGELLRGALHGFVVPAVRSGGDTLRQLGQDLDSDALKDVGAIVSQAGKAFGQGIAAPPIASPFDLDITSPDFERDLALWASHTVGAGLGSTAGYALAWRYGGKVGAGGFSFGLGVGQIKNAFDDQLRKQGKDPADLKPGEYSAYVWAVGAAIGAVEHVSNGLQLRVLGQMTKGAAAAAAKKKAADSLITAIAKGVAKGALTEGIEEGVQDALTELTTAYAFDLQIDWGEFAKRVGESAISGALPGAVLGVRGGYIDHRRASEIQSYEQFVRDTVRELQEEQKAKAEKEGGPAAANEAAVPATVAEGASQKGARPQVQAEPITPVSESGHIDQQAQPAPLKPDPGQDVLSFIRQHGGIYDETGDLAAMDAPKSIINNRTGLGPDEMREALVEAGYISDVGALDGTEPTTSVSDVYEIVRRALAGEKVFAQGSEQAAELAAYESNRSSVLSQEEHQILSDLQDQYETAGLHYDLSDAEENAVVRLVREKGLDPFDALEQAVISNLGGKLEEGSHAGTQTAPSGRGPAIAEAGAAGQQAGGARQVSEPGTNARVSGQSVGGLADYLRAGGSLATRARSQIAEAVGIQEAQVKDLLDRAEVEGVVAKDRRGRYRRGPSHETYKPTPELDLQAAQTAAQEQDVVYRNATRDVLARKTVTIAEADVQERLVAIAPIVPSLPEGTDVGILQRIVPIANDDGLNVSLEFRQPDGSTVTTIGIPWAAIARSRAGFIPARLTDRGRPLIALFGLTRAGESDHLLAGGVKHELVHFLWSKNLIPVELRRRLLARAHDLGVLDMQLGTFLQVIGDASAGFASADATLRDQYLAFYKGRDGLQELLDQEAVAHLIELNHHGYWTPEELAPVQSIIAQFESGGFKEKGQEGEGGEIKAAVSGRSQSENVVHVYRGQGRVLGEGEEFKDLAYWTDSPERASDYAKTFEFSPERGPEWKPDGGAVYSGTMDTTGFKVIDWLEVVDEGRHSPLLDQMVKEARDEGYPGVIVKNVLEDDGPRHTQYVPFDKSRVKTGPRAHDLLMAVSGRTQPGGQTRMPSPLSARIGKAQQSRVPMPGLGEPRKSLSETVADLNRALGIAVPNFTHRVKRLNQGLRARAGKSGGKLEGQYDADTGVARTRLALDIRTLAHEGGHALEHRYGPARTTTAAQSQLAGRPGVAASSPTVPGSNLRDVMEQHRVELEPLATPGGDILSEGFAEFFALYIGDPAQAENKAPNFYEAFDDFLDRAEPGLRAAFDEVQKGYEEWKNTSAEGRVASEVRDVDVSGPVMQRMKRYHTGNFEELWDAAKEDFDKTYQATIDKMHPVQVWMNEAVKLARQNLKVPLKKGQFIGVTAGSDAYKQFRMLVGAYQAGGEALIHGVRPYHGLHFEGPSLRDAMGKAFGGFDGAQWTDERMRAFNSYLWSRNMVERYANGNPFADKESPQTHQDNIAKLEEKYPAFAEAAQMVYQYQKNLLRLARDAQIITDEAYQKWTTENPSYVPAQRHMDEKVGGGDRQAPSLFKPFYGSTRDGISPLQSIAKFTYELHHLVERNDAIRTMDEIARSVGPGGGALLERIPAKEMRAVAEVDLAEEVRRQAKRQGLSEQDLLTLTSVIETALGEDSVATIYRAGAAPEAGEPIIYLYEKGQRIPLRLPDGEFGRSVYEAVTNYGAENINWIAKVLSGGAQTLRMGVVFDPAYLLRNLVVDQLSAAATTPGKYIPYVSAFKQLPEAVRAYRGDSEKIALIRSLGGITGGPGIGEASRKQHERMSLERLRRKGIRIRDAANPFDRTFWELTGLTETASRAAVWETARERARKDGLSEWEAAKEATFTQRDWLDWDLYGSKMLTGKKIFHFMNVSLQGLRRGLQAATGNADNYRAVYDIISPYVKQQTGARLTVMEKNKLPLAAKFWAMAVGIGMVGLMQSLLYRDDDEYADIKEYFRDTHWVFKAPDGTWVRVPKPFELAALSNIFERSFEAANHDDPVALQRMTRGLSRIVLPPHEVAWITLPYELWANKSTFSGAPIVPPYKTGLDAELQANKYTSEFSKWMAGWTGLPAAKIDHTIFGALGGIGRSAVWGASQIVTMAGGNKVPPAELRLSESPVFRRFVVDPVRSSQSKEEFWNLVGNVDGAFEGAEMSYKRRLDAGSPNALSVLQGRSDNEKAYALLNTHGRSQEKKRHPLNYAGHIASVGNVILNEIESGELRRADRQHYSPSERRVIQDYITMITRREIRNALILIEHPGWKGSKIIDTEPLMREFAERAPDLYEEYSFRLEKKRLPDFAEVRAGWASLKQEVLDPMYPINNPTERKSGRRTGYDVGEEADAR